MAASAPARRADKPWRAPEMNDSAASRSSASTAANPSPAPAETAGAAATAGPGCRVRTQLPR